MQKTFKRNLDSLDEIFTFISDFITQHQIANSLSFTLNLVVEELFTNMVKHNVKSRCDVQIDLQREENLLKICLTDFDVEPFDITKIKEVDVDQHLEERKVGGLGIHLVKQMMDDIHYEYKDRMSRITLIKHLE
ncbi:MAG: ATP-binding protein [bacterium]